MTEAAAATVGIRLETAADATSVRRVLEDAFAGTVEAGLVEHLRAAGDLILALVAEYDGRIVGHVAFPRLTIVCNAREEPAVGLASLAVVPSRQREGIGSALVRDGLARLRDQRESLVFVLGDTGYYRRFGFEVAGPEFRCVYSGPHFMLVRLRGGAPASGAVRYPAAFSALD